MHSAYSRRLDRNRKRARNRSAWSPIDLLIAPQASYFEDPARLRTLLCSRRAGKSYVAVVELTDAALRFPGTDSVYLAISRQAARDVVWRDLQELSLRFQLGAVFNEVTLTATYPNGSRVQLRGVSDRAEAQKLRGRKFKLVILDEAQLYSAYVRELVLDVIMPTLLDCDGRLTLAGTPGMLRVGFWYETCQASTWSHHTWTLRENPHLAGVEEFLAAQAEVMGGTSAPRFLREFCGTWTDDEGALVFRFQRERNAFTDVPSGPLEYVLGVDLGFRDSDAIAVLAGRARQAWLVEEDVKAKQTTSALAGKLRALIERYHPAAIVGDPGGIGAKVLEDLRVDYGIPIVAATKTEKLAAIEKLNDCLASSRLFVRADSRAAHDFGIVQWDPAAKERGKLEIAKLPHSDILDSLLYAHRYLQRLIGAEDDQAPEETPEARDLRQALEGFARTDPLGSLERDFYA